MSYFSKKTFTMRQVIGLLTGVFLGISVIAYAEVTVPNSFSNGQTISSGQVNENFSTLATAMPAAAFIYNYSFGNITSSSVVTVPISTTITPPRDGYIIVRGSGNFTITQSTAANNFISVWVKSVSSSGTIFSVTRIMRLNTTGGSADEITEPIAVSGVFSVTGGVANTISIEALRDATATNTASFGQNSSLEVLFVPNLLPCTFGFNHYGYCQ